MKTAWAVVLLWSLGSWSMGIEGVRAEGPAPRSSVDDEQAARDAFERGRVFYDAGEFDQASSSFEEAYRLSGRDGLLYNIYLANRDANQQEKAAAALRDYLAKVPNIDNRAQLEARLTALEAGLARQREQDQQPLPAVAAPTAEPAAPVAPPPSEDTRNWRFYAGVSLAGAGGAALLSSIATGLLAKKRQSKLEDECDGRLCDASLEATADSGKRLAITTDALLFGGIALAGAGAALLVFGGWPRSETSALRTPAARPRARFDAPRVTAGCSFDGCVARTSLRF